MLQKDLLKKLEQDFVKEVNEMDKAVEEIEPTRKEYGAYSSEYRDKREDIHIHAELSCYIAELIAKINGTTSDHEHQRLFAKYNLSKEV